MARSKLDRKYIFENNNGRVVYMKKTPRQFAKWKRQLEKRYAGECFSQLQQMRSSSLA